MLGYVVFGAAALFFAQRGIGHIRYRRLDWPRSLSYYAYRRYVIATMKRFGWAIDPDVLVPFDFVAQRGQERLAVFLFPPGMELYNSKVKDISGLDPDLMTRLRMVCVTASQTPSHLVDEALRGQVHVIWYKDLPAL